MHLLLAQKGAVSDGDEAIDLGQSPADLIFISAADTELAALARAKSQLGSDAPELRLANMMALSHPMSIDVYAENTVSRSKFIIVRCLGGESYWPYGLEKLYEAACQNKIPMAVLPGDDKPDPSLARFNTISEDQQLGLWQYLVEGGEDNARGLLKAVAAILGDSEKPAAAIPLLKAGLWWPGMANPAIDDIREHWVSGNPVVAITFYRALVQSGNLEPIEALVKALLAKGMNPLPIYVASLKEAVSCATIESLFGESAPDVVLNTTGFAVSSPNGTRKPTVLEAGGAMVLQVVLAGGDFETWQSSPQGLSSRDLAMNVALPEVDGRVFSRAIAFKSADDFDAACQANIVSHRPIADRVEFVADLAANWAGLRQCQPKNRKIALILANYPNRDGRLGNGVGLDTPAATIEVLRAMKLTGYQLDEIPANGDALIEALQEGPTNAATDGRVIRETLSLNHYNQFFGELPKQNQDEVSARWGAPESDPFFLAEQQALALPLMQFGNVVVGIQPARGYNIDPKETYHSPDLVPPHGYFAFYCWLREQFSAHAIAHMGKHGNLEWLPGKALALSENCYPEAVLGPIPHLYPFIVNDPGEGTQAKRRSVAVIIDHLTPPLTRAETYGPLKQLEILVDEYYEAAGVDPRRLAYLKTQILNLIRDIGLDQDAGIDGSDNDLEALEKLDAYLCDLKEMQIRDGLHIFGLSPQGRLKIDLAVALARVPRGVGEAGDQSLQRAIADDFGLDGFDPLDCDMGKSWTGAKPELLAKITDDPWRTNGDTVERIELLATALVGGEIEHGTAFEKTRLSEVNNGLELQSPPLRGRCPERTEGGAEVQKQDNFDGQLDSHPPLTASRPSLPQGGRLKKDNWVKTNAVLDEINNQIMPSIEACGPAEIDGFLTALNGRFVLPGPSGAPTRGRVDVLPTGRNFYSVDSRVLPTPAAWALGQKSAELLLTRHRQENGEWPKRLGLSAWGTSNMRTGGDDIAQMMALIGVKPQWEPASGRVTGFEIIPLAMLGRPRIDVTLRISGFFRDAFPAQVDLLDRAIRAVMLLEEDEADNPLAARFKAEQAELVGAGMEAPLAAQKAGYRIFGSKPGAYGAGLQALMDEKGWNERSDLAKAYLAWGSYAYGQNVEGSEEKSQFERRLGGIEAIVHNQDNREHDLLDSDDYYQFEGGMSAAVEHISGQKPIVYHNDHSRPERPVIRTLEEEVARVVRGRVTNPKWIKGVMRHGYKGAFEIAATVDYLFAFSATTGAVRDHHFDAVYQAFIGDETVLKFMADKNPEALKEMADRLLEAQTRNLWTAKSNSARFALEQLSGVKAS